MSLSRIIAGVALGAAGVAYSGWSGDSARLVAADAILAVAQTDLTGAKKDLKTAREKLEDAAAINAANLIALDAWKAEVERQTALAAKAQAAERKRAADLQTALKRIKNAPKSEDGPIAPVLRRELDDLRTDSVRPDGNGAPAADPTNQDPSGADDGSG